MRAKDLGYICIRYCLKQREQKKNYRQTRETIKLQTKNFDEPVALNYGGNNKILRRGLLHKVVLPGTGLAQYSYFFPQNLNCQLDFSKFHPFVDLLTISGFKTPH